MPRMFRHGGPGHRTSALSPKRMAASLITCSLRSTAAMVFGSLRNAAASMPCVNCLIASIASVMSCKERVGSLKGTHALARGAFGDGLFQRVLRSQVHGSAKKIGKTVLEADHIEQRKMRIGVE